MGRKKEWGIKYGCPIYGIAWPPGEHVYICGGGGHGIENKVGVLCCRDGVQSEEVAKLNTGKDAAYRLVMHPSGRSLVCGMSVGGLERVDVQATAGEHPKLSLSQGEFKEATSGIGPIKGMSFSGDGRLLALGGEDGSIEVWEWPHMRRRLRWEASPKAIRNVDFSPAHSDGVLISCDEGGACKLWSADSGEEIAQLAAPADMPRATFFRCKTAVDLEDGSILLFTPMKWKRDGWIVKWRQDEDGSIRVVGRTRKPVAPAPICGFELSRSGELMAAVTPDGDQVVIDSATLQTVKYAKGVHMTFATSVAFSPDEQYIISGSSDASAVLTRIARPPGAGATLGMMCLLCALLVALAALLLGLLLHYAQAQPEEARAMLAPLAPALRQAAGVGWLPQAVRETLKALT